MITKTIVGNWQLKGSKIQTETNNDTPPTLPIASSQQDIWQGVIDCCSQTSG